MTKVKDNSTAIWSFHITMVIWDKDRSHFKNFYYYYFKHAARINLKGEGEGQNGCFAYFSIYEASMQKVTYRYRVQMLHSLLGCLSPIGLRALNDYWMLATESIWNLIVPVMSQMMQSTTHASRGFVMFRQILHQIKSWWRGRCGRQRELF